MSTKSSVTIRMHLGDVEHYVSVVEIGESRVHLHINDDSVHCAYLTEEHFCDLIRYGIQRYGTPASAPAQPATSDPGESGEPTEEGKA